MTAATLHQIADLMEKIIGLKVRVDLGLIDNEEMSAELDRIFGELYRLAKESRSDNG